MAFCPNCGAQVSGAYCPNCGTAVAGGAPGAGPAPGTGPNPGYVPPATPIAAPGLTTNVASALCYLFGFITGIIFLVLAPYNQDKTVRFHAYQSIFANIAVFIIWVILGVLTGLLFVGGMWWTGVLIHRAWDLVVFIGWLYMMYTAYNNRRVKLPVVGDLAAKQS